MLGAPSLTEAGSPGRPGSPCGEGTEAEMGQTHRGPQGPSVSPPGPATGVRLGHSPQPRPTFSPRRPVGPGGPCTWRQREPREKGPVRPPTAPTTVPSPQGPPRPGARRLPAAPGDEEEKRWSGGGTGSCGKWQARARGGGGAGGVRPDQAVGLQGSNSARWLEVQVRANSRSLGLRASPCLRT